ncbi:peptide ABC transporter periplasmic peptide-binding protein, partial [Pseudomonas syringae pv. actinidiae ICMP 19096]
MKPLVRSLLASALVLAAVSVSAQDLRIGYADPVSSLDPQLNNY